MDRGLSSPGFLCFYIICIGALSIYSTPIFLIWIARFSLVILYWHVQMREWNRTGKETRPEGTSWGRSTKSYETRPKIVVRQTSGRKGNFHRTLTPNFTRKVCRKHWQQSRHSYICHIPTAVFMLFNCDKASLHLYFNTVVTGVQKAESYGVS